MFREMATLKAQIKDLEIFIADLITESDSLTKKQAIMKTVPGIGTSISVMLLAALPELGLLTRRQIACLAGLAPHPKDSGSFSGYRSTSFSGRYYIKSILHMAAFAAARSHSPLGDFYRNLISNGKKPIVALTALKRKIVVIINARIRDHVFLDLHCPVKV